MQTSPNTNNEPKKLNSTDQSVSALEPQINTGEQSLNAPIKHESTPPPIEAPVDEVTEISKENNIPSGEKKRTISKKEKRKRKRELRQANAVYKERFRHFRILHLSSIIVGILVIFVMMAGMWQLYMMVFSTIEDTEHLFLINERRRTETINFSILEDVREQWKQKYTSSTNERLIPLFPLPEVSTSTTSTTE